MLGASDHVREIGRDFSVVRGKPPAASQEPQPPTKEPIPRPLPPAPIPIPLEDDLSYFENVWGMKKRLFAAELWPRPENKLVGGRILAQAESLIGWNSPRTSITTISIFCKS